MKKLKEKKEKKNIAAVISHFALRNLLTVNLKAPFKLIFRWRLEIQFIISYFICFVVFISIFIAIKSILADLFKHYSLLFRFFISMVSEFWREKQIKSWTPGRLTCTVFDFEYARKSAQ